MCHSRCPFWPTNFIFVITAELSSLDPPPLLSLHNPIFVYSNYGPIFKKKITCVPILPKRYDRTWRRSCSSRFKLECWRVRSRKLSYLPSQLPSLSCAVCWVYPQVSINDCFTATADSGVFSLDTFLPVREISSPVYRFEY